MPSAACWRRAIRSTCSLEHCGIKPWWKTRAGRSWHSSPATRIHGGSCSNTTRIASRLQKAHGRRPRPRAGGRGDCRLQGGTDRARRSIAPLRESPRRGARRYSRQRRADDVRRAPLPSPRGEGANLLYFLVKDHPFTDGNKRIGSLLFLLYLRQEGLDHDLNPQALTALTLLIAESAPANKDLLVRLIVNLLVGSEG
ncbi:MAG: hypothetical protein F4139_03225 [Gemmatimonadetes bacterium]|nr:hypothetical protein [Gemmatimonadota bacterium]MYK67474.1 hypothetical protein [Gemmatimonadota bacterium]